MHNLASLTRSSALTWLATSAFACAFAEESSDRDAEPTDEQIEEIIVTGSRLLRHGVEASMPVTVLSRRDIERGGADSIGKVLQALPAITGSQLNTNVNGNLEFLKNGRSGDGSVRTALRGGSLVLLNGRRFPNGGLGADSSVDLNMLPVSWIDHVEVLSGGASAVYGADAVGGVINIVTRRGAGIELASSRSITASGDGEIITGEASALLNSRWGDWGLGIDYVSQDGVTLDRRSYSEVAKIIVDEAGTLGNALSIATPEGRVSVPAGNSLGLEPGDYTLVAGTTGQSAADYRPFVRAVDGFNTASETYSQTPNERTALWLLGSQSLGEHVRFFMEGLAHRRISEQQVGPEAVFAWHFLPELADGVYGIPADHYYNHFGVDLLPPGESGPATRRFVEAGPRTASEDVDMWRVLVGLEGSIGAWNWQASIVEARSGASTVETGFFVRNRFIQALGPSGPNAAGDIVCGRPDPETGVVPAASVVPDCVPLDLFGGPGTITKDQIDFMSPRPLTHTGTNEERVADLFLTGPWGRMFDRPLQWVLGASYRHEAGSFIEDPLNVEAINHLVPRVPVQEGHSDAKEIYAELSLPIVGDRPWARAVVVNFGARRSDFSYSVQNSWQAGLNWQVDSEVALRASYSQVFRAPTMDELYGPSGDSFELAIDPCGNDPTPEQRVNCAANGVPGGAYVEVLPVVAVISGGNPHLDSETGYTVGAGLVYTPTWARGVSASVDYARAVVRGSIGAVSAEDLLYGCAEHGLQLLCNAIRRRPDGRVALVLAMNTNLGWLENSGVDMAIDWQTTIGVGDLAIQLLATYLDTWDEQPVPGWPVASHAGTNEIGALPRWRAQGNVDWYVGRWSASYSAEYIGSYREWVRDYEPHGIVFDPYTRSVEPVLYHDVEAGFEFDNGVRVRAAITNVLDEDPPYVNGGSLTNTDDATYRLLGRTYFLELRYALK
jgi:iron complex outermembrane receptor protein